MVKTFATVLALGPSARVKAIRPWPGRSVSRIGDDVGPAATLAGAELGVAPEVGAALAVDWDDGVGAPAGPRFAWPGLSM